MTGDPEVYQRELDRLFPGAAEERRRRDQGSSPQPEDHSLEVDPVIHYTQTLVERWGSTIAPSNAQKQRGIFLAARRAGLGDRQITESTRKEIQAAFFEAEKRLFGGVTPLEKE